MYQATHEMYFSDNLAWLWDDKNMVVLRLDGTRYTNMSREWAEEVKKGTSIGWVMKEIIFSLENE